MDLVRRPTSERLRGQPAQNGRDAGRPLPRVSQVLVLDKSGSMWSFHNQLKEFAKSVVRQFVIGPTSTAIGLVEFSTDARVLPVGGVNGLSFDADALMQVIDEMNAPNGWTHINAGLEKGLHVMLGTNGTEPNSRPNVRRRIMILLTDGEQNAQFGGTKKAIETATATAAEGDFILKSVGFGGILESTLNEMASEPISENAFLGSDIQAVMEHFSGFCSQISSPRPPPPPSPLPAFPAVEGSLLHSNAGCGTQGMNLGTGYSTQHECLAAALSMSECGRAVMWSIEYNYNWGCRCCAPGGTPGGNSHNLWDVWGLDAPPATPAPTAPPPSPPRVPSICDETCMYASDGECDDGGVGSQHSLCDVRALPSPLPPTPTHMLAPGTTRAPASRADARAPRRSADRTAPTAA